MKTYYFFQDYQYIKTLEQDGDDSLLSLLNTFQIERAETADHLFTVMNVEDGYAFSQTYRVVDGTCKPRKISHGRMFKHETGIDNPEPIPSYDTLLASAVKQHGTFNVNPSGRAGNSQWGW